MKITMKITMWIFSVLYVAIPSVVVWLAWTNQMMFREGLESETKVFLTATMVVISVIANIAAWGSYLRWKERWKEFR